MRPHAEDHTFFYGINFEFSFNHHYWEDRTFTSEVRPIVGLHLKPWDIIFNPIVDTDYTGGFGTCNLFRLREWLTTSTTDGPWLPRNTTYGSLCEIVPVSQQFHEVWAVMDHNNKMVNIEAGVGVGYTAGGDRLTFKLMLSRDMNKKHEKQTPETKPPQ